MDDRTDYGKLAYLKTDDLSRRLARLEGRKDKESDKYKTLRGYSLINAALVYLSKPALFSLKAGAAGTAAFFFRLRLNNPAAACDCYIDFYAGGSLIAGGQATLNPGTQELCFAGGGELSTGTYDVSVRIEGLTGRTLISADYSVSGYDLAFVGADNFLSVCVDESNVMYAVYSLPSGTTRITVNSGATWRSLYNPGTLGKTAISLTERGGAKAEVMQVTIQNNTLYALDEISSGRVIEIGGVTYACGYQLKGCDDVYNIIYIKNNKAYYVEVGTWYFSRPLPVLPGMKFTECFAVIKAPSPMFILTDTSGESILLETENIPGEELKIRTVSAVTEAE